MFCGMTALDIASTAPCLKPRPAACAQDACLLAELGEAAEECVSLVETD